MWPDAYFEGLRSSPVGTFCPSICCPFQKLHALMITRICWRENSWNVNGTDRRIRIFLNILTKKTFSKTRSLWVGFACVMNVPGLHLSHLLLRLLLHGQEFNSTSFCYYIPGMEETEYDRTCTAPESTSSSVWILAFVVFLFFSLLKLTKHKQTHLIMSQRCRKT